MAEATVLRTAGEGKPAELRKLTPVSADSPAPTTAPPPPKKRGSWKRPLLFLLLPIALVAGGYQYVTGGQVMETDNAYVHAKMEGVSTDVAGTVIAVEVHDNERVTKGQVLYRLRPDTYRIALDGAKAQLDTVHDQVVTLQESYKLAVAQVEQAEADLPFYQTQFDRQKDLLPKGAGTQVAYDSARHDLESVQQKIRVAKAQAASMLAQLGGDMNQRVEDNAYYRQAKSMVDNAQKDLNDTIVRAPFDGVVTNVDSIQVGTYLQASQQAFSLVSTTDLWIEAEPKETELTYVRPGQSATISMDTYPGVEWKGEVQSMSPASGSSFSLLPAQNTTGNWVKVVQRLPIRIRISETDGKPPLRVGMSAIVGIDTGHARGWPQFVENFMKGRKDHG
jgi:membrane fusion protein (multidrug efflux system)